MVRLLLFITIFCFSVVVKSRAGNPLYFFTNYSDRDGLSHKNVRAIIQGNRGFLWVGTSGGLNRFNGSEFKVYKSLSSDTTTISSNSISDLLLDRKDRLWVSGGGICRYIAGNDNFQRYPVILENGQALYEYETFFIYEDTKGHIWAGTNGVGLLKLNEGKNRFEQVEFNLNGKSAEITTSFKKINSIVEDSDGTFWLSGAYHLIKYSSDRKTWKAIEKQLPGESVPFQSLQLKKHTSDNNLLWIGSWGKGLILFDKLNSTFRSFKFESGKPENLSNIVKSFHRINDTTLWLGTNQGIFEFNEAGKNYVHTISDSLNEKSLVNNLINYFYKDDDNILWIASQSGLSCIDPNKQNFVKNKVWNRSINFAFPAQLTDTIIAASYYLNRRLYIYDQIKKTENSFVIPGADQMRAEPFRLLKDSRNNIWIGTTKGLYLFNEADQSVKIIPLQKHLGTSNPFDYIHDIIEDNNRNIWIACSPTGLVQYNHSEDKFYAEATLFGDSFSSRFSETSLLINDNSNGIIAYSSKTGFAFINTDNYSVRFLSDNKNNRIVIRNGNDLLIDRKNKLWMTTSNQGLVAINQDGNVENFVYDNLDNLIDGQQSLLIDASGTIWLTANRGLFSFNPVSQRFNLHGTHDGLPLSSDVPGLYKFKDDHIGLGIDKGLLKFNPLKFKYDSHLLQVHFTSIFINEKEFTSSTVADFIDTLQLTHDQNNITFHFAATNFSSPKLTKYSFIIEGLQDNWSEPTSTPVFNLTQLQPGEYTLKIKAGANLIPENAPVKTILIKIIPAWWQTLYFRIAALAILLVVLILSIRNIISWRYKQQIIKMKHTHEIEQIRTRISRDIHDDIGAGLTKINFLSRGLSKKLNNHPSAVDLATKISLSSEELIQNLGEIVWAVNPENDSLENIVAFIRIYLSQHFEDHTDIVLSLDLPEPENIPKNVLVNPDVKSNLLMIIKESINNIIKHSHATVVIIKLYADRQIIDLSISDNGTGLLTNKENSVSGNGIKNMYKRAKSINAQLKIESEEGAGTTTSLTVALK